MGNQSVVEYQMPAIPAHIAAFYEQNEGNIVDRQSVPSLSFEGKVWTISVNGEKTKIMKDDGEGTEVPRAVMNVVILGFADNRGRSYYKGTYDPAKASSPACWSDDSKVPHPSIKEPEASKCDGCPLSAKGSRISDNGKSTVACSQHRMVAVVPANDLHFTPLRMKLSITSLWDDPKDKGAAMAAKGWFAFDNFKDMLRARGVKHTASIVTKMSFDPNVAYPKVLFRLHDFLGADGMAVVAPVSKSEEVKELLQGTWTPAGADGKSTKDMPADDDTPAATAPKAATPVQTSPVPAVAQASAAPAPVAAAPQAPVDDDEATATPTAAELAAQKAQAKKDLAAAKAQAAADKAKAAARAPILDDDEGAAPTVTAAAPKAAAPQAPVDDDGAPPPKAAKAAPAPATTVASVPAAVAGLMDEWDD